MLIFKIRYHSFEYRSSEELIGHEINFKFRFDKLNLGVNTIDLVHLFLEVLLSIDHLKIHISHY